MVIYLREILLIQANFEHNKNYLTAIFSTCVSQLPPWLSLLYPAGW